MRNFFIVQSGVLTAVSNEREVGIISAGCVAGALSFFGLTERGETVKVTQDAHLWEFDSHTVETMLTENPLQLMAILKAVGRQFAPVCKQFFELGLQTSAHKGGDVVFLEGAPATCMYLTISGRVRALKARKGGCDLRASRINCQRQDTIFEVHTA